MNTDYINNLPVPALVVGKDNIVTSANSMVKDVFVYDDIVGSNFFALVGIKREALLRANEEEILIERNERKFKLKVNQDAEEADEIVVFFAEKTIRESFREKLLNERPSIIYINIDNYDELLASVTEDMKRLVPSQIDGIVRKWGEANESPVMSMGDDSYVMISNYGKTQQMIADNFSVLEEVRAIEADVDFPISISIGVGISSQNLNEAKDLAQASLELALGRGGDQAVVKEDDNHTQYYGGSSKSVEKNNRGKARVIAHAIRQLIKDADRVMIMGHRWPDMDSFGAAIGMYSICKYLGKDAYIVMEEHNNALEAIFQQAMELDEYNIIKHERALELATRNTVLIIVDVNRPSIIECPELLDVCKQKVLIDHHRLTEDSLQNTTVAYNESYASSASELVSEIIQYIGPKRIINKFEGESLMAGIMVDTNNFSGRTGVRTFEAAAWLKRAGADTTEVKRFFQAEREAFQTKANAIANAEFTDDGIAYARPEGASDNAVIINAQVADELLMVKGVSASFVIGTNDKGQTIISARSIGDINVQTIMEKFGGGGHFTSAAAQINESYEEVRAQLEKIINEDLKGSSEE